MIDDLSRKHPGFAEAIVLGKEDLRIIREEVAEAFDPWLKHASESTLPVFRRVVKSLRRDYEVVMA